MQKEKQTKGNYKLQTAEKDKLKTEFETYTSLPPNTNTHLS